MFSSGRFSNKNRITDRPFASFIIHPELYANDLFIVYNVCTMHMYSFRFRQAMLLIFIVALCLHYVLYKYIYLTIAVISTVFRISDNDYWRKCLYIYS